MYFNLHRRCFSVQTRQPDKHGRKRWIVTDHTDGIVLRDCRFVVSDAGRERVRAEGCKNVHAFIYGTPVDVEVDGAPVRYDPYAMETFQCDGEPVHFASLVACSLVGDRPRVLANR